MLIGALVSRHLSRVLVEVPLVMTTIAQLGINGFQDASHQLVFFQEVQKRHDRRVFRNLGAERQPRRWRIEVISSNAFSIAGALSENLFCARVCAASLTNGWGLQPPQAFGYCDSIRDQPASWHDLLHPGKEALPGEGLRYWRTRNWKSSSESWARLVEVG